MGLIGTFLNEPGEIHTLWYGFLEAYNLFSPQAMTAEAREDLWDEMHYFYLGMAVGAVLQCAGGALVAAWVSLALGMSAWWAITTAAAVYVILVQVWIGVIAPAKQRCITGIWAYEHIDLFDFEAMYGPYSRRLSDTVDDIYLANLREAREESALWDDEDDDEGQAAYQ